MIKKPYVIIIPARLKSKRLYAKPLIKIKNKELIIWVIENCLKKFLSENVFVATDSKKIFNLIKKNGYNAIMTSKKCLTGTDRVAEVTKKINSSIYINVQGDEPLINPNDIKKIIKIKKSFPNRVICAMTKIKKNENIVSVSLPKVVVNERDELLYISRSPIPAKKDKKIFFNNYYKQVCIYAYNKSELNKFYKFGRKSKLEKIEDIEILRFFDLGIKVKMMNTSKASYAVDTLSDIKMVRAKLK